MVDEHLIEQRIASVRSAMGGCAGLRNLIAHAYGSLDLGRLFDELPGGRDALLAFCAEIAAATRPGTE